MLKFQDRSPSIYAPSPLYENHMQINDSSGIKDRSTRMIRYRPDISATSMPQRIVRAYDSRTAAQKTIADRFRLFFDYVIGCSGCHLGTYGKMANSICGHAFSEASFDRLPLVECCSDWYLDMERSHNDTNMEGRGLDPQINKQHSLLRELPDV